MSQIVQEAVIKKSDDELHIVWGEVFAPGVIDSQGDFMLKEDIMIMAHSFMKEKRLKSVDVNHDNNLDKNSCVVESFVARKGDDTFAEGSWVVGIHIPDDDIWSMFKTGELNGFSMEANAKRIKSHVTLEIEPLIEGETQEAFGHVHQFTIRFDEEGQFLGGSTSTADGHSHKIVQGTITEPAGVEDHVHRYSFMDETRRNS